MTLAACGRVGFEAPVQGGDGGGGGDGGNTGDGGTDIDASADSSSGLQVTRTSVADTALNSFASSFNYGAGPVFNVRTGMTTFVGLVRFDLSSVSGTVMSATLQLTTTTQVVTTGRIDVWRVLEAWDEGVETGAAGEASYDFRQPTVAWTAPGCGAGSRSAAPLGDFQPFATNTRYDVALPIADVQAWIDDPSSNHGLAFTANATGGNEVAGFHSREAGGAMVPTLVVEIAR